MLLFDYRGYGASSGRPERARGPTATRAPHAPAELSASSPIVELAHVRVYLGESLGGAVALELALAHPPGGPRPAVGVHERPRHGPQALRRGCRGRPLPDAYPSVRLIGAAARAAARRAQQRAADRAGRAGPGALRRCAGAEAAADPAGRRPQRHRHPVRSRCSPRSCGSGSKPSARTAARSTPRCRSLEAARARRLSLFRPYPVELRQATFCRLSPAPELGPDREVVAALDAQDARARRAPGPARRGRDRSAPAEHERSPLVQVAFRPWSPPRASRCSRRDCSARIGEWSMVALKSPATIQPTWRAGRREQVAPPQALSDARPAPAPADARSRSRIPGASPTRARRRRTCPWAPGSGTGWRSGRGPSAVANDDRRRSRAAVVRPEGRVAEGPPALASVERERASEGRGMVRVRLRERDHVGIGPPHEVDDHAG